jgi:glycyl-tRNA synthetase beta chain
MTVGENVERQVLEFIVERARFVLKEGGLLAYDEVNAAFAAGADDLVDAVQRASAMKAIRKTKNFEPLAISFKRIRKILEKAGPATAWKFPAVRPELFTEEAERQLQAQAASVAKTAEQHKRDGRYREALQDIARLRPAVDDFFKGVMVMADEEDVRRNRLTLLSELLAQFSTIADFSEIVAAEKE